MFTAVLIAPPDGAPLDSTLVEALRSAWGGSPLTWLAPGEAVEFKIPARPDNQWDVWANCQAQGIDLAVLPNEGRRKQMLIADMDSTMIQQECIDELADAAGIGAQVKDITARAMNGELDFEQALRERVGLLKGLPEQIVADVLAKRITLMPGAKTLLATMKAQGAYAILVSGGFTAFSGPVAAMLGFDANRANQLLIENGKLTGEVSTPILGREAKVEALDQVTSQQGLSVDQVIAVGDGANDLGMLSRAGMGVALHAKPMVAEACDYRINHGDLTALLYLQGYQKADFVA